jgi:hypothetical protein
MKRKLSKQTLAFLVTGSLCLAVPYLVNKIIPFSQDLTDFLKGFGVSMIITSLLFAAFNRRTPGQSH